jgi:hypothetical protein
MATPRQAAHDDPLEPAIRAMIDATNREDRAGLLAAFADEATLTDFGRTFAGTDEIARWSDNENIGTHNRIAITDVTRSGSTTTLRITVAGNGYNGPGAFHFELHDEKITHLEITS